jgi:hypothetical protein
VVQPDEHPPLPPASGTPIGYLVDDAAELKLSDDQLAKLKAIDEELAAKLEVLDGGARGTSPAAAPSGQRGGKGRGLGFRGGGRRGGAGGRNTAYSGSGSGSAGPRRGGGGPDKTEERADDVRDAIARAMAQLDVVQRVQAKRVLADHGVDLDAGRPKAKPTEPEQSTEPDEPDAPDAPGAGSGGG